MMRKVKVLNIALAALAIPLGALVARDYLISRYPPEGARQTSSALEVRKTEPSFQDYALIVEGQVFPSSGKKLAAIDLMKEQPHEKADPGPSILAELKLVGTYMGPDSFAIFERSSTGTQEVLKGGETLEGARLKTVLEDRVVFSTGRKNITISLEGTAPPGAPPMGTPPKAISTSRPGPSSRGPIGSEMVLDQNAVVNSLDNIGQVLSDARLTPRTSGGAVEGFSVTEIKPGGIFDGLGLRNGDVLKKVNGYEIDSPEKAVQVLSGLRGETSFTLDIIRGGENLSLRYQVR